MVIALDLRGFAVSSGAACSSGAVEPSHVLLAIGLAAERGAVVSIRFSLGRSNTAEQVDALVEAVAESVAHLRRIAPVTRPMPEHPIAVAMSGGVDSSTVAGHAGARRPARHRPDHAALEPAAAAGDRARKARPAAAARSTTSTMRAAWPGRSASLITW